MPRCKVFRVEGVTAGELRYLEEFRAEDYADWETIENTELIAELEEKLRKTEAWERTDRVRFFGESIPLLLTRGEEILHDRRMYRCIPPDAYIRVFMGVRRLPLGLLVELWLDGALTAPCPHEACGGTAYLFGVNSRQGIAWGFCPYCRKRVRVEGQAASDARKEGSERRDRFPGEGPAPMRLDEIVEELRRRSSGA